MTIEHKNFLLLNKLSLDALPDPIREKIEIYDRIQDKGAHTWGEDKAKLNLKLMALDLEILEDLETEFEESLAHNVPCGGKDKKKERPSTDEQILDQHFEELQGRNVLRSQLRSLGIQAPLASNTLEIGKYILKPVGHLWYEYRVYLRT